MFYFPFYTPSCFCPQLLTTFCKPAQPQMADSSLKPYKQDSDQNLTENADQHPDEPMILEKQDLQAAGYPMRKKNWSEEEDNLLFFYRDKKKMDWDQIAKKMKGRNKKMCYSRYRRVISSTKDSWLKKDDQELKNYVEQMGENWEEIAKLYKNRNPRQIKDRYNNFLRPGVTPDSSWTLEEDFLLVNLFKQNGKNWSLVEAALPGRSSNQIKNRYYGRIKRLNQKKLEERKIAQACQ